MEPQQSQQQGDYSEYTINETHNLVIQNIVKNEQIKFTMFHKIDHMNMKIMYRDGQQHKFLTGLVVAGRKFIKLYALFSDQICYELVSHKIYEDITGLHSWQKCIVIQTKHKIVGLTYQDSTLKNAFMLSLQFLPLTQNDQCSCSFDKHGFMFTVYIKNFLIVCFSSTMNARYKTKPLYKQNTQIVNEDVKWNKPQKTYIEEVIKIKIADFQISQVSNMNICNESLYFIGLKNLQKPNQNAEFNQKAFYHIQTPLFFVENKNPICQFLAKKDNQVLSMIPYVFNKQMQCIFCKKDSIYVQIGRQMILVGQFQSPDYQILHKNTNQSFSLWVKTGNSINVFYRSGNGFMSKRITIGFYFQSFLLNDDYLLDQGTIVYSNQTQLGILNIDLLFAKKMMTNIKDYIDEQIILNTKNSIIVHKSLGSILDFQFSKNSIFLIQSKRTLEQGLQTKFQIKSKLYELRRSLVTDPKPYITHAKKNYLQELMTRQSFKSIKTIKFCLYSQQAIANTDNLIVCSTNSGYQFYFQILIQNLRQNTGKQTNSFVEVLNEIYQYSKIAYKSNQYLVLINNQNQIWVQSQAFSEQRHLQGGKSQKHILPQFNSTTKNLKTFFIENYFIYELQNINNHVFRFYQIFNKTYFDIEFLKDNNKKLINLFTKKKHHSFKKKQKIITVVQFTFVYENQLLIYQIYPQTKQSRSTYQCLNISKGVPILFNYLNKSQNEQDIQKDKLRSITCPQYALFEHHINVRQSFVKNSFLYQFQNISLLVLVNSQDDLIVYKKHLSFQNQIGYIYRRYILPLNIVKAFKYINSENTFQQIGQGLIKISNIVICKGEFLQHNLNHVSYFQMDGFLWTIEKEKIKMIDLKPLGGSNQALFRQSFRKDSKDFGQAQSLISNTLQDNIEIMSNFILTPVRTMMRKQLMGLQISGDYFVIYSKSGFQVIGIKDMKPIWTLNLAAQNPQRKQVIINIKSYGHFIAVSYYDYILEQNTQFKSIKFKFRIYNILSKTKILQRPKSTDQPILHIRSIGFDKLLLASSSTLYVYNIKSQKVLEVIRTRNFSKRFALNSFSYIPEVLDQKTKTYKPCYMLFANQFGGLSFHVGRWIQTDQLRQQWFEKIRCHLRNIHLFHYGEQLKALITDQDCNLIVINLKPDRADKIADFNVGSKANVLRIRNQQDKKIYSCFEDGTIKCISATKLDNPEVSFLDFQQDCFSKQIPFMGGFNLRASRLLNQKYRTYKHVSRGNMVDCDILEEFFSMSNSLKQYACEKSQLSIDQLKSIIRSV